MASDRSRISTNIDFEQEGFQTGTLRVPHSVERSAYGHIPTPIAVLKRGNGPTALLTGANHGDEYEGPIALMKLLQRMPSMQINGRLIVAPGLNFPAFLAGRRTSPIDAENMNPIFTGRRDGTITEMIAHYVAIDDFGTQHSNLDLLSRFPFDFVKIDGQFVAQVDRGGTELIKGIVSVARHFGLLVIAEGVETEAQHRGLRVAGLPFGQGHLYQRPLQVSQLAEKHQASLYAHSS